MDFATFLTVPMQFNRDIPVNCAGTLHDGWIGTIRATADFGPLGQIPYKLGIGFYCDVTVPQIPGGGTWKLIRVAMAYPPDTNVIVSSTLTCTGEVGQLTSCLGFVSCNPPHLRQESVTGQCNNALKCPPDFDLQHNCGGGCVTYDAFGTPTVTFIADLNITA